MCVMSDYFYPTMRLFFLLFCLEIVTVLGQVTRLQYPTITSVSPSLGSVEGGTWVTITGVNFMADGGLSTSRVILIGGQVCKEIHYYTTTQRIICVAPKCVQPQCLADPLWQGSVTVSLNVYVQNVETILGASSTFTYHGSYTPQIFAMIKNIRGSAVAHVTGRISTDSTNDLQITIGPDGNKADLGDPGEINSGSLNMWSSSQQVFYEPPSDMSGGFYNLTFQSQDDQSRGYRGTGFARMFPDQVPYSSWGFPFYYNWDCSLFGTVFNVQLQPVVASVSPAIGSIAGGTLVTIRGSGFSKTKSNNVVMVAGLPCDVQSADFTEITCLTRPVTTIANDLPEISQDEHSPPQFSRVFTANSSRNAGSPGWWVQLWNTNNFYSNSMTPQNMKASFGWKMEMTFSLQQYVSTNSWPSLINYVASTYDSKTFAADLTTDLIPPISGAYRFYVNSDDTNYLYITEPGKSPELLLTTSYSAIDDLFAGGFESHMTRDVYLTRGVRYRLKSRLVNTGSQDFLRIGLRLAPNFTDPTNYSPAPEVSAIDWEAYNFSYAALQSEEFLHHHSLKTIQIVSLSIFYQREVQTVVITGIQGGQYSLIVEESVATEFLSVTSSSSSIAQAIRNAALQISNPQCTSFSVSSSVVDRGAAGKNVILRVTFNVDKSQPMTLLSVFTGLITGNNVTFGVTRTQTHSIIPSGSFQLSYFLNNATKTASIPINADADRFRSIVADAMEDTNVAVRRTGGFYTGYSWIVTFITPRGDIPTLEVNTSQVIGQNVTGRVSRVQNGSESVYWFNSIPLFMAEVPLDVATSKQVKSNAEVYLRSDNGEYLKAVCDGESDRATATSFIKGRESDCAFSYSTAATAIVSGFSLYKVDPQTTGIEISGNHFNLAGDSPLNVGVTIAGHDCNVTYFNASHISCLVKSVPWGRYHPIVNIAGYGNAILANSTQMLTFKQSIYSISPEIGSFAGGQIVTIFGRGFREDAVITFGNFSGGTCQILTYSSSMITCRTPPASYVFTALPTSHPTPDPSRSPTLSPTAIPTEAPTEEPTFEPTFHPTASPSVDPTAPPTFEPTLEPTLVPSEVPTLPPSDAPTMEPTEIPVEAPTMAPTESILDTDYFALKQKHETGVLGKNSFHSILFDNSHQDDDGDEDKQEERQMDTEKSLTVLSRENLGLAQPSLGDAMRRKLSLEGNTHVLFVDGMTSGENNLVSYTYSLAHTPEIDSVTPLAMSSAITYNVTITGRFLSSSPNISVLIGSQPCGFVNASEYQLSCVLKRDKTFGTFRSVDVKVFLNNEGYAGLTSDHLSLPTIDRGFTINEVSPMVGSVMGGNQLTITGFGFLEDFPERHFVQLVREGLEPLSDYDDLLTSLGFKTVTEVYSEDAFLNCSVTSSTLTQLVCYLPGHVRVYNESNYRVRVTLNSISSHCDDFSHNCSYSQAIAATPLVFSNYSIVDVSSQGEYTVSVFGTMLNRGSLGCLVYGLPCQIISNNATQLLIRTAPIPTGSHLINISVTGMGFSQSFADLTASAAIHKVQFASKVGSMAGGVSFNVSGYGFSPVCEENVVDFTVLYSDGYSGSVTVSEWFYCSTNFLFGAMPSSLAYFSHGNGSVQSMDFNLLNSSSVFGAVKSFAGDDTFEYRGDFTPTVVLNATSGSSFDKVRLSISFISPLTISDIATRIDSMPCFSSSSFSVVSGNKVEQVCTIPLITARALAYPLRVKVEPFGYAIRDKTTRSLPMFTVQLKPFQIPSVVTSSMVGGSSLNISGYGFPLDSEVYVCGARCRTNDTITNTGFECTIPQQLTKKAINSFQSQGFFNDFTATLPGTYFSSLNNPSSSSLARAHDSDYTSYFSHYNKNCFVGIQLQQGYVAQPIRVRFYPRLLYANYIGNLVYEGLPEGSSDYIPLAYSSGARSGWNYVDAERNITAWFTAFRYRALDTTTYSQCFLAEIEFLGTLAWNDDSCPVTLKAASVSHSSVVGSVLYSFDATPEIFSVSPSNGTALGGTTVTITGNGFGSKGISVKFSGQECLVQSYSENQIICVTSPRPPEAVETSSIKVTVADKGLAVVPDGVEFLYIDKWSALTSWRNQEPPVDGDLVWVPDGQVILLDQDTPLLAFLLIEGSLYFDRTKDLKVDSYYIFVLGGYMEVGTEDEPFEKNVEITLYGDRYRTIEVPMIGNKFLGVASKGVPRMQFKAGLHVPSRYTGQLEIHGKKRLRTWTFVNHTAPAGSWNITTTESVDFAAGEKVILTGSDRTGSSGFEELTVAETKDNRFVYFTSPLRFRHTSYVTEIEGRTIPIRCEIGLLSRNIVIQGDDIWSDAQLYGVHTISFLSGIYHMENAEIRRCGQAFNFGRYCTHSHMAGDMEGSYVKANSIHHSYQRAVTTHDTNNWEVRDNVAFNIQGHAYFVEDGAERNNYFSGNLGVYIIKSSALLKSDMKPAIYWTATPTNFWRDNVAAHSTMFGFWFELVGSIDSFCPVHDYIGEHVNNTFHSNSNIGLRIYPVYLPLTDPCGSSNVPSDEYIYDLLSFHNGGNGIFGKHHGNIHHVGPTLVGNGGHDISIVHYETVRYTKNPAVRDALLVGTLPGNYHEGIHLGKFGIWTPQDENFYIKNVTFVNYGRSGAISGCNDCLGETMKQGAFTTRFEKLKFVNTELRLYWSPTYKEILWDLDGTLAGVPDSMITMYYDVINWPDVCQVLSPTSVYSNSLRCGGNGSEARIRRVNLDAVTPSQLSYTDVTIMSEVGESEFFFLPMDTYGWVFPAVTGTNKTYTYKWVDAGISAYTLNFTLSRIPYMIETMNDSRYNEDVLITYSPNPWDYWPYSFATTYNGISKYIPHNFTRPMKKMADAQFNNITMKVLLTNKNPQIHQLKPFTVFTEAKLCPPGGCPIPPPPTLDKPMLWSRKASWPSNKVPTAGQRVVIESNMWIIMDVNPPKLACIVVYGRLTFWNNATTPRDLKLQTQCMQVYGEFKIAGVNDTAFPARAEVVIYGGKGASLPITMTEGVFLGAKVIAVSGNLTAIGQTRNISWTRLHQTATAGTNSIVLSEHVPWAVGDEITLSPTAYFGADGNPWFSSSGGRSPADEIRIVTAINYFESAEGKSLTQLTLNSTLAHTHLCEVIRGQSFCGAVGVLTRNVRFVSEDSERAGSSYGFGAHIHMLDIPKSHQIGRIHLSNVEMKYFGKVNSDRYAITLAYATTASSRPSSVIQNCSFNSGYNFALRTISARNVVFVNNVASRNIGGGVFVDDLSEDYLISGNLIIGTRQLPSVTLSSYPWVRPIAGVTLSNNKGICRNNLVAGSEDQGFTVATSIFHVPSTLRSLCQSTFTGSYSYSSSLRLVNNSAFWGNEAVGGKGGLFIMAAAAGESRNGDCSVVKEFFSWRNAHTGIIAIDSIPNLVVSNVILAENHIAVHLHFVHNHLRGFAAVLNSTIMSSLVADGGQVCNDLPDSLYLAGRQCHVWSTADPLAQQTNCQSIFANMYRRVGLLVPMFTNKARTCTLSRAFSPCDPPNTPDRLCQMPWEKRYALPNTNQYNEFHVHDVEFIGFNSSTFSSDPGESFNCIPSATNDRTAAIALNPTEYDTQPTIITSNLRWTDSNVNSRVSFDLGTWAQECSKYPCPGHQMVAWNDLDGSLTSQQVAGQLFFNNPQYLAPYPQCYEVPEIYLSFYLCPSVVEEVGPFKQYSGLWLDSGPQIIQPLVTSRAFSDRNVSYASFGPLDDMCAMRFYFSQFNFLWADRTINKVMATGTVPPSWTIRWDAPSADNVAVLEFFISNSQVINVYVSDNGFNNFIHVPSQELYPTFDDPAGTNIRDPQKRMLAVTIRGGSRKFYRFVVVPVAAVTIKMAMTLDKFFAPTFVANVALLLQISPSRIKITSVRAGSVIADFEVTPAQTVANSTEAFANQVTELNQMTQNLSESISSGTIQQVLNVTVDQVFAVPPIVPVEVNPVEDIPENSTFNATAARLALIQRNIAPLVVLYTYPTSFPTSQPSQQPSTQPTSQPTRSPSSQPTTVPSSLPSSQPSGKPSSQPSSSPSSRPSTQPSSRPTSSPTQPSSQPTTSPSSQPSSEPTAQPSRQPTSRPSTQPSAQPTRQPSSQPSRQPTSQPSGQPTGQPTRQPVSHPTSRPSGQPSSRPTSQPSALPTAQPSRHPTAQPSSSPSSGPTSVPTNSPSGQPTGEPSSDPSSLPTSQPSGGPSSHPTGLPSSGPSSLPTGLPSSSPSGTPSSLPSSIPSSIPSSPPSTRPTSLPSTSPSGVPSTCPTVLPSSRPTSGPSSGPSGSPTSYPSKVPSTSPTSLPTGLPTTNPTSKPSGVPSSLPSAVPTNEPTDSPSSSPTSYPSENPTSSPSVDPTSSPSSLPTSSPTAIPSSMPSGSPTGLPTSMPTSSPTSIPSSKPTTSPTSSPSAAPTSAPSSTPTSSPSVSPTASPSSRPSSLPTASPTALPSAAPSSDPSAKPTSPPTSHPTRHPTPSPTAAPSAAPSATPTDAPTFTPTLAPTFVPTATPSETPSASPTVSPTPVPSATPTESPTAVPTAVPSYAPTPVPTEAPTDAPTTSPTTASPSRAPSATPTVAGPTLAPSAGLVTNMAVNCSQILQGCSPEDLRGDSAAQSLIESNIGAAVSSESSGDATVSITSISGTSTDRKSLSQLSSPGVTLTYTVRYFLSEAALQSTTVAEVYSQFAKKLQDAVGDGSLEAALRNSGITVLASVSTSPSDLLISNYTVFVTYLGSPSESPTSSPGSSEDTPYYRQNSFVAGVTIGSILVVGLAALLYYRSVVLRDNSSPGKGKRLRNKSKEVKVIPLEENYFTNLEELDKPVASKDSVKKAGLPLSPLDLEASTGRRKPGFKYEPAETQLQPQVAGSNSNSSVSAGHRNDRFTDTSGIVSSGHFPPPLNPAVRNSSTRAEEKEGGSVRSQTRSEGIAADGERSRPVQYNSLPPSETNGNDLMRSTSSLYSDNPNNSLYMKFLMREEGEEKSDTRSEDEKEDRHTPIVTPSAKSFSAPKTAEVPVNIRSSSPSSLHVSLQSSPMKSYDALNNPSLSSSPTIHQQLKTHKRQLSLNLPSGEASGGAALEGGETPDEEAQSYRGGIDSDRHNLRPHDHSSDNKAEGKLLDDLYRQFSAQSRSPPDEAARESAGGKRMMSP